MQLITYVCQKYRDFMTKVIRSFLILFLTVSLLQSACKSGSNVSRTTTLSSTSNSRTTTLGSSSSSSRTTTLGGNTNSPKKDKKKDKTTNDKNSDNNSSSTSDDVRVHPEPDALKAVRAAKSYTGTKYKYGGMDKKGMDCSGLMHLSYKSAGVDLPRTSHAQSNVGKRVYVGELIPGDLIFFGAQPGSKKISHVGIVSYSQDGEVRFMHASSSRGVVEDELTPAYWTPRYIKATRPTVK